MTRVVLAGGGTAGHVEPALAVARQWMKVHPESTCTFLGTSHGLETILIPAAKFELSLIRKVVVPRRPSLDLLKLPISLLGSVVDCAKVIRTADIVVGFGGYVSAPAYIAAAILRKPLVIHEANAKPGWANKLGATFTKNTAVAMPVESGKLADALIAGLPLRADVATSFEAASADWKKAREAAKRALGFQVGNPLVLVVGGSQGSQVMNSTIEGSLDALLSKKIQVLHAVGKKNELPAERDHYKPVNYITEMAQAYLAADLVIARSGAVTCSEIGALGRYALFVPLSIGNGEQGLNAEHLASLGKAEIINQRFFTAQWLSANIDRLIHDAGRAKIEGSDADLHASEKIVALMESAL